MRFLESGSSRWLAGIGALVILLVVVSVVVGTVMSGGEDDLLAAGTPEGTVQRYLLALEDNEPQQAFDYLSADLKEACAFEHFLQTTDYQRGKEIGAAITESHALDGARLIDVEVTEFNYEPPFGQGRYTYTVNFTLAQEGGAWRFTEPPWPVGWCDIERKLP
jgi:hypothetical protein